ncbi:MAG: hypothetical protein ACOY4I_13460 [Bacillota bacterium]
MLREAFELNDAYEMHQAAHYLKSGRANIGALGLSDPAKELDGISP